MSIFQTIAIAASALIVLGAYIPYAIDIVRGRVLPARAARLMFVFLLVVTVLQQGQLHSGTLVAVTLGELMGSIAILSLALKRGVGGLSGLDKACYTLLVIDVVLWSLTGNALLALHLSVIADFIAFTPTLVKTWRLPQTETPLFFVAGAIGPMLNILGAGKYSYAVLLFPAYLVLINLIEVLLILLLDSFRQTKAGGDSDKITE